MPDTESFLDTATLKNYPNFILVFDHSSATAEKIYHITRFMDELKIEGFHYESEEFSGNRYLVFIKLHAPDRVLYKAAEDFDIELACFSPEIKPPSGEPPWRFMRNDLNTPTVDGVVHDRAPHLLNVNRPQAITSAEKILVLYTILNNTRYGNGEFDVGFEKLLKRNVLKDGFPLHDGTHHWTDSGPVNERQLLNKYWSRMSCLCKAQPLDVIHHYFGTSTGFYFAWLGFYNRMLLPMAIGGLLFFVLGLAALTDMHSEMADEICNSHLLICPICRTNKHCSYEKLKNSCFQARYTYAFDNPLTFAFAILMPIWSAIFVRAWKRQERILQMRWNVKSLEMDSTVRFGFKEQAQLKRTSPITGEEEPYIRKTRKVACYFLSLFIMFVMLFTNAFVIIVLMLWSRYLVTVIVKHSTVDFFSKTAHIWSSILAAVASVTFAITFETVYRIVAFALTNLENPRTQMDYENSYVYKIYTLAFVNNYTSMFYVAFFKGKFYTHPGDSSNYDDFFGIGTDICDTFGCIWDLGILMLVTMLFRKTVLLKGMQWLRIKVIQKILARLYAGGGVRGLCRPIKYDKNKQWEREYLLQQDSNLQVLDEYLDMAIQYGYVIFFVACFPLAPLLAWINNVVAVRLDARMRTVAKRRIVPLRVMGLGAWHHVFLAATLIGFITNASVIAFTSDFIPKEIYLRKMKSLKGYVNFSLSVFDTDHYFGEVEFTHHVEPFCYYPGYRHDPGHPNEYQTTPFFTYLNTVKIIFVVVFVHVLFFLSALVSLCINTTPFAVMQLVNIQEDHLKELKVSPGSK